MNKIIKVIITVIVIAIIIFLGIQYSKKQDLTKVFSFTGRITEIQESAVIIRIGSNEDYGLKENTLINIAITEQTKFAEIQEITVAPTRVKTGDGPSLVNKIDINFEDLNIGNLIIASSNINIKKQTSFEAVKIEVLN